MPLRPPDELTESLGKAFAASLAKAEGQLTELQYLWEKIPDKSQEICIKRLANQRYPQPVKTLRAIAKTCKTDTRQMLLYSTYETTPEVAGHMLLFAAGVLGTDANQALSHALQHTNGQIRVVAFRMLARTNAGHAVAMARKLLVDDEPALRKDARLLLRQTKDPVIADQIPKLYKTTHFKNWQSEENSSSLFGPFKLWDRKVQRLSAQSEIVRDSSQVRLTETLQSWQFGLLRQLEGRPRNPIFKRLRRT